ncbi:MAG: hypothetical protein F4Y44_10695, partial [Chloroflexi bacterium]|nr:hypothetical protein [Chloroflexota bacterium]
MTMTQTVVREPVAPLVEVGQAPVVIRFEPVIEMTSELFEQFCAINDEMRIELTAERTIEIMPPLKGDSGEKEADIIADLKVWARVNGAGRAFSSNAGFTLPNRA